MIGNDIIDIAQTKRDSNWERPGFLQKVFTQEEQELIAAAQNPFLLVWRLWSMKESIYKIYMQQDHGKARFFNPTKICCKILSPQDGVGEIGNCRFKTKTEITSDYIYSNAFIKEEKDTVNHIFQIPMDSPEVRSEYTYQQIFDRVAADKTLPRPFLKIKKTETGVPKLFLNGQKLDLSFSISHHGHYGAFTILN